jgi:hydrogenase maturation protease
MEAARILIAGIGNIFLGDDGFGCEVTARLARREWHENVRVVDFGIRALDLVYALSDGYDAAILVDAVPRGGEAGTVYLIDPDLSDQNDAVATFVDAHAMDPMKVLSLVRLMGGTIRRVLIVGCEPLTIGPEEGKMGLSDPVAAAVDDAVNCIESLVGDLLGTSRSSLLVESSQPDKSG